MTRFNIHWKSDRPTEYFAVDSTWNLSREGERETYKMLEKFCKKTGANKATVMKKGTKMFLDQFYGKKTS